MVAENGYKIVEAREAVSDGEPKYGEGEYRMITDGLSASVSQLLSKPVEPLENDSALHRNFASLDLTEEAYLSFAAQYGLLGGGLEAPIEIPAGKAGAKQIVSVGEPVKAWTSEVESLRNAIHLWELVQGNDGAALKRYFEEEKPQLPPKFSALVTVGQSGKPAFYVLKGEIRAHLQGQVPLGVTASDDIEGPVVDFPVQSLRVGLWLMLSLEIHDQRRFKSCAQCGKWFEILTGARRTTRVYCSDACRIKTYRGRQEEARRMHAEGAVVKAIAKKLDTDTTTVEKWIGGGGAKKG